MKSKLYDCVAAFLFVAGILIAGAESTWWPWSVLCGAAVFSASGIMAIYAK